ncbi:UDP-3-O-(3-hydroxymyristoyl)glucosamine N-acyltransferase [Methylovirgula sp. 4M-Z18]|uniref:UDP-3-O-(3-hydroxymyristoyl)glucosamine N-acyltransferase n=1 Tax=Methylovirgula sp. 4M-Z18 TaxID=2293567 RepID=UPI000E2F047B|nr:UDP-3-O-(3-hydroxymyristoyl)glucosamine N-acyltransferase [Methylovirgula sp. 4M-Z18]RFB80220.1 UDP-3-O-(3-hydroxymyristoyl)glucosamine N-acyltransferase [Methylovirgula sp. 4M-Z18]
MNDPVFFRLAGHPTVADIAGWTGAALAAGDPSAAIESVAPLERARQGSLTFLHNPKYVGDLAQTQASACLLEEKFAHLLPPQTAALVTPDPHRAFATAAGKLFPEALKPGSIFGGHGLSPGASVHPEARLEPGVTVDPGAVIGPRVEIGAGSFIGANAVIGADVRIGRDCSIGPNASVVHALIGNRVIVHSGARIGQDGFGFAMGPRGHQKLPQLGRVVIQDDVEIGANTTIDRGTNRDTVIGEGTKIDNLVQIAHNVTVGRHCVIVSQVGISGSTTLQDFVVIAGQAGLTGHLTIGMGAQIGAQAGVMKDVPAGAKMGGSPATTSREWLREVTTLRKLAANANTKSQTGD